MADPRPQVQQRSSSPVADAGAERVETLRQWRSTIVRSGEWRKGETLRPQPWHPPAGVESGIGRRLSTTYRQDHTVRTLRHRRSSVLEIESPPLAEPTQRPLYTIDALAQRFGDRYQARRRVALGGMAEVWLAEQASLRRDVAIKVLSPGLTSAQHTRGFEAEALIASHLSHPNIVPVYDGGADYLVMKYVEGRSLAEDIVPGAPVALEALPRLIEALIKACDAIAFAHARGIVHCDIKPQNVMMGDCGEVLVMDWGLATVTGSLQYPVLREALSTGEARCAGTPGYMAPEMAQRCPDIDTACDVFLLGAMLYEILCGEPPFEADTPLRAIVRSADNDYRSLRTLVPHAPARLTAMQEAAMRTEPGQRIGLADFSEGLRSWMGSSRNEIHARQALESAAVLIQDVAELNPRWQWEECYHRYDHALYLIDQARTLVPDDEAIAAHKEQVLTDFRIAAISAGELFLARLLASGRLPPRV